MAILEYKHLLFLHTGWSLKPSCVLYNGHSFGADVGGGIIIGVGNMLPYPLDVQASTKTSKKYAPWAYEGTKAILRLTIP